MLFICIPSLELYKECAAHRQYDQMAEPLVANDQGSRPGKHNTLEDNNGLDTLALDHHQIGYELRLDLFPSIDVEALRHVIGAASCPVMLTVRKRAHGGGFNGSEKEREELIESLLTLKPHFFDLEADVRADFLEKVLTSYPHTRFVLSYHNLEKVPHDLDSLYAKMSQYPAYAYKIAAMAQRSTEALQLLLFARQHPHLSAICMGESTTFARVLGAVMGNVLNYASYHQERQTAPGQLSIDEWLHIYRYPVLNTRTSIYGLIGDPVEQSVGHLYHNRVFAEKGLNAVYVKIRVQKEELAEFMTLAQQIGIKGLSVTMPLKELVPSLIHQSGAINTLRFDPEAIVGTNTDGEGALDAIEKKMAVRGKKVVIVGAGGAARAIAIEAKRRGAILWITNRTFAKAQGLAADIGAIATTLEQIPHHYDLIINCTPDPSPLTTLQEKCMAMDIVYSKAFTAFVREALAKECIVVEAKEMFFNQAARQTLFWLSA